MIAPPKSFRYTEEGPIAHITLDRPKRLNALTFEIYAELRDLFAALSSHDDVRVVVITGAGRAFCSGGDVEDIIGELFKRDTTRLLEFTRLTGALVKNIRALPKPVIAALNGTAVGAGAVIALACDFRIVSDGASLAFLFTKVGLSGADMGAAYLLPRIVGLAHATEMLMLGDKISAADALRLGLVSRVVPADKLQDESRALAKRLAEGPSFALGLTKTVLNHELDIDFAAALEAEAQAQALCMQTADFRSFYDAFTAKRPPKFQGR